MVLLHQWNSLAFITVWFKISLDKFVVL